jgi:hypothetical protein
MHFLRPDKSYLKNFTSEYAVGDFGWLMTLGFLGVVTGALFIIIGLLLHFKPSKISVITLSLWCLGMLLAALFKTDVPVEKITVKGLIHGFAALLAFINLGIAMIAWGFIFNRNNNWKNIAKQSCFFGVISIVLFVIFFMSPPSFRGLTQRMLIVWDMLWLLLVNRGLFRNAIVYPKTA